MLFLFPILKHCFSRKRQAILDLTGVTKFQIFYRSFGALVLFCWGFLYLMYMDSNYSVGCYGLNI